MITTLRRGHITDRHVVLVKIICMRSFLALAVIQQAALEQFTLP
ncbi:hypothetical protein X733_33000 [Mesorhizobium sp. L2C067A000]|nr:hypothetical protein X733_33000 [Mesorhizobium sp. L2C067A000]